MARIVIDTNIHVTHLVGGPKNNMMGKALSIAYGYHTPLQSEETYEELKEVLHRPKFDKYIDKTNRNWLLDSIKNRALFIDHNEVVDVSPDPKDNKFFALAKAGGADFILSGDKKDVLAIEDFPSKQINARDFIDSDNEAMANIHKAAGYKWFKQSTKRLFLPEWCDSEPV